MMAAVSFVGLPDIPAILELRRHPRWVAWHYAERKGRLTKPPINPHTGMGGSHSDPRTWGTYEQAVDRALKDSLPGVGYVMSEDDEYTGADLDKCRDPDFGGIEPWAEEIVRLAETYTEVSPSGTGLRLIWRGKVEKTFKSDTMHVEVYRSLRYLTITGEHVPGTPTEIKPAPKTAEALWRRVESHKATTTELSAPVPQATPVRGGAILAALTAPSGGSPFFRNVNDEAIRHLGSWVPALFGSAAIYQASTGAWRVSSEDLGRDLEEDLSIAPNGIVDFGLYDMGDPREGKRTPVSVVLEHGGAPTAKDAAFWLCDRLGTPPEALGWESRAIDTYVPLVPPPPEPPPGELILTAAQFIARFTPPEYLVDGILQRGYLYSLTARTGAGKTAVAMYGAQAIARGEPWHGKETTKGGVLFLAGENPDDIRARYLVLADQHKFVPGNVSIHFVDGVIDIAANLQRIKDEAQNVPDLRLVIVDTAAAYFRGDDANSNAQQGAYARLLRQLTFLPGLPTVLVCCHPVKNATRENLIPLGGGAFLNEVDGNLTLWAADEGQTQLHWQGKFRGPEFEPMTFRIDTATCDAVKDNKGRLMPSVVAVPIGEIEISAAEARTENESMTVLSLIERHPRASVASIAIKAGWISTSGKPLKSKVFRIVQRLREEKLIETKVGKHRVTNAGKRELGIE